MKRVLERQATTKFSEHHIRPVAYRPFVKQFLYGNTFFAQRPALTGELFPAANSVNRAICVPGVGSTKPFSTLMVNSMPDLHFLAFGQCFPLYRYEKRAGTQPGLPGFDEDQERVDNITDAAVRAVRVRYGDNTITKDRIFDYVYGVLHARLTTGSASQPTSRRGSRAYRSRLTSMPSQMLGERSRACTSGTRRVRSTR